MLEGRIPGPEWIEALQIEQLLVGFDGGEGHPIEREQQHRQNNEQRQIERNEPPRQPLKIAHAFAVISGRRHAGKNLFRLSQLGSEHLSHCSPPAATCAAAARTRKPGSRPIRTESWRSKSPRLRRVARPRSPADTTASPSAAWR